MKLMTVITLMTLMPIDTTEERYCSVSTGRRVQARNVSGVALLALIQHEVCIAEETPGEVKLAVTGYGGAKKAQGGEIVRCLPPFVHPVTR